MKLAVGILCVLVSSACVGVSGIASGINTVERLADTFESSTNSKDLTDILKNITARILLTIALRDERVRHVNMHVPGEISSTPFALLYIARQ